MPASPGPLLGAGLTLGLLLGGCSGNPFGERLAAGFDPPATAPLQQPGPTPPSPLAQPLAPSANLSPPAPAAAKPALVAKPAPPASQPPAKAPTVKAVTVNAGAGTTVTVKPAGGSDPVPYRVTLKLPGADPAAPAEAVTQALRAAGVRFEVETIERIRPSASSPAAPPR